MKTTSFFKKLPSVFSNIFIMIFSLSCIFPVIWLIYSSLKTEGEFNANIISFPKQINIDNYISILTESNMLIYMKNSFIVTTISVVLTVSIGFVTGYLLSRFRFKGSKILYAYYLLGMIVPIHALMIPMYILFSKFNLVDNLYGLAIPYVAFGIPIAIYLVQSYMKSVPIEIEEAAHIDGSSFTRTVFSIILPVCMPILATIAIIQFFACWNEFSFALTLISGDNLRTVPLGLTLLKGQFTQDYPRLMTSMIISMAPIMVLYFMFSKQIMKGMTAGAVKG